MARKEKEHHYIYKTTNLKNQKYYIGMHSTDNLNDGYMGSGKRLRRSLNKYGKENFRFEILEFLPNRLSLKEREKELVNEELLKDSLSMNLKLGGEGGFSSEEHRDKFLKSSKKTLEEAQSKGHQKMKILRELDGEWFKNWKLKISDGLKKSDFKHNGFLNKTHTEDSKKKMSDLKKGRTPWNKGIPRTEEDKEKIRETLKKRFNK